MWKVTIECPKKVPPTIVSNTKLAKQLTFTTIQQLKLHHTATDFLTNFLQHRAQARKLTRSITYKQQHNKYRQMLLDIQENDDVVQTINNYWKTFWTKQGSLRCSIRSRSSTRFGLFKTTQITLSTPFQHRSQSYQNSPNQSAMHSSTPLAATRPYHMTCLAMSS